MKRFVVILVLFVLSAMIFCFAGLAFAEETDIKVTLDGEILTFDQNPIIQNERVLVPLRKIFESLSAEVSWDPGTQAITVVKAGTTVNLTVGLPEAYINDSLLTLDQPPVIVNDRTLVPIRFVSEALGAKVDWDAASRTVRINSEPEASQLDAGENYKKGLT